MQKQLAQALEIETGGGKQTIKGPLQGPDGASIDNLADVINVLMPFLIGIGSIILFLVLIWGGYGYLTSQGEPEKLKSAKARITTGFIGFILLISAYVIVRIIASVFGLDKEIF